MVTAANARNSGKLTGKDFIFIAIFGVLLFIVFFVFAMVLGMNANTFWFTHAIGAIPGGIVWMYLVARVPKRGAILVMSLLVAVVGVAFGDALDRSGGYCRGRRFSRTYHERG